MKKKLEKRLVISKETLRDLSGAWLREVAGGMPSPDTIEDDTCDCPPPKG